MCLKIIDNITGNAVINKIFAIPIIILYNAIFSLIAINKNIDIPIILKGVIVKATSKNNGDNDFKIGLLVKSFVSANGCFFPHFEHIF